MYHTGKIIQKYLASPTVMVLELEVPSLKSFLPGQWVDFVAKPNSWIGGFSIASGPSDLPKLTIAVKQSEHNPPSKWVHEYSSCGSTVEVQVGGDCTLSEDNMNNNSPAIFCAGGIGISPILSLYREHIHRRNQSENPSPTRFLYSVSKQEELVFGEELIRLTKEDITPMNDGSSIDQLTFSLTQSKKWDYPSFSSNLNVDPELVELKTGRMMKPFLNDALQQYEDAIFYLCGPPKMLDDGVSHLEKSGVPSNKIKFEKWW